MHYPVSKRRKGIEPDFSLNIPSVYKFCGKYRKMEVLTKSFRCWNFKLIVCAVVRIICNLIDDHFIFIWTLLKIIQLNFIFRKINVTRYILESMWIVSLWTYSWKLIWIFLAKHFTFYSSRGLCLYVCHQYSFISVTSCGRTWAGRVVGTLLTAALACADA